MKTYLFIALISMLLFTSCRKDSETPQAITTEAEVPQPVPPAAKEYSVDTTASVITWIGSKPTGKHKGTLKLGKGSLFVKNGTIQTGNFIIDMKSITVTDPKEGKDKINLENHLKGKGEKTNEDHFFNIDKYPSGTFEITGITSDSIKTFIEGNLTLKDITKNVKFPATVSVNDSIVTLNSESFKINRILWNINYNSKSAVENLGNQYIDDYIELTVNVIAKRK